tara:strand:+ start:147 stop:425 length:279 start_codon:yes stop_codon:yes gene_type:complete
MILQREVFLTPLSNDQPPTTGLKAKVVMSLMKIYSLVPILIRHGADFRKVLFNDTMHLSGGYSSDYGPWVGGVSQFSWENVHNDVSGSLNIQ